MKAKKLTIDTLKKIIKEERSNILKERNTAKLKETKETIRDLINLLKEEKMLTERLKKIKNKTKTIKKKIKES